MIVAESIGLERRQDVLHARGRRERRGHEVLGDRVVLAAREQDPVRVLHGAARAADLLVVGDRRARPLVVDDEAEVRLVEPHPQRHRRHQRLEPVREQVLLQRLALRGVDVRVVRPRIDAPPAQPARDALRVGHREAVHDAGAGHRRQVLRQPGEPLRLVPQRDRVQVQRVAGQRSADHHHVVAQLARHVLDHAVVRGRGRAQDRDVGAQRRQQPADAPVVRHELVAPVADAVRLVHHEHADRALDPGQQPRVEVLVGEALRGDEQDVDAVADEVGLDGRPVVAVGGVDRHGAQPQPVRGLDLVAHQAEQRAHDQRRPVALVPPDPRGDPVDEALAPARPLHDERPRAVADHGLDRLALALAERRTRAEHGLEVGLEGVRSMVWVVGHAGSIGHRV